MKTIAQSLFIILIGFLGALAVPNFDGPEHVGLVSTTSAADRPAVEAETWTTVEPADGEYPTKRHETSFVQVGNLFYLLGGRGLDPVEVYDPVTRTWSQRNQIPVEMHHFQAIEIDGLIYVAGAFEGRCCEESPHPIVYIYDPFDDQWIDGPAIPAERRRGSSGAVVYNDQIYLISGLQVGHESGWVEWVDRYDPATNTWEQLADAPRSRDHFHAGLVGDKIVVAGGRNSGRSGIFNYTIGEVDIYDIPTNSWSTATESLPSERAGTAAAVLGNELLIIGGESGRTEAFAATEAFNVTTGAWRTLGSLNRERHGVQAITNNGVVYIAAGSGERGGNPELDSLEAFNYDGPPASTGTPLEESSLVASQSTVDFGERLVDSDATQELILTNQDGNQAIVITDLQLEDQTVFATALLHTLPIVVAPGESVVVTLGFGPAAQENYSSQLFVAHSGKDNGTSVTLMGSGTDAPPANQPPSISNPIDDFSLDEDSPATALDLSLVFSDPDQASASLNYSVTTSGFPAVMLVALSGPSMSLLPLPNTNGEVTIQVHATDDEGLSATDEFVVTVNPVNDAPFIAPNEDLETNEGEPLVIGIIASDPESDLLEFEVITKPNMDIVSFVLGKNNQGTLRFEPGFDDAGIHTVTITVRDPAGLSATHLFSIEVLEKNTTPILAVGTPITMTVGQRITATLAATDQDGDPVIIQGSELPSFVDLSETLPIAERFQAKMAIAPTVGDEGAYNLALQAVDPSGQFDQELLVLNVEPAASLNRPPAISAVDDVSTTVGTQFTLTLAVADADLGVNPGESLTVSLADTSLELPTGARLDHSRVDSDNLVSLLWDGSTPSGTYSVTLKVADAGGLSDESSFVITVHSPDSLLPPQPVSGVGSPEIQIFEPYSLTVQFVDPNADPVTLTALSIPAGARFTDLGNGTGLFEWQPSAGSLGLHDIVIRATDSTGLTASQLYTLLVAQAQPMNFNFRLYFPTHQ